MSIRLSYTKRSFERSEIRIIVNSRNIFCLGWKSDASLATQNKKEFGGGPPFFVEKGLFRGSGAAGVEWRVYSKEVVDNFSKTENFRLSITKQEAYYELLAFLF